jgi:predicted PurR-regulated permease PerM
MPATPAPPPFSRGIRRLDLLSIVALIGLLYFAQDFFVPLVLAALLSFLLDPVNRRLEHAGMKHLLAVLTTTCFTFLLLGVLIYLVTTQVLDVAEKLPAYRNNLIQKANSLRMSNEGPIGKAVETIKDVAKSLEKPETPGRVVREAEGDPKPDPVPVQVVPSTSQTVASAGGYLGPILSPLGSAAVVLVIAIFMMIGRDDLRDRIVHLVGRGRLRLTTHALDEAARRVSRYLFAQLIVNVTYGIPVGIGLYFIGIPNAMLWGLLAIVLRFLPYIGPWIAAAFPVVLSIAVSTSWTTFALTIGLFVVIELISNNVVEPWLYGAQTGLSPLAVIVSAVFWTWLWGIPGLVLATPLTVCLVVMGKHVPHMRWLDLLLGDRPPITGADRLYHRLLIGDEDEAHDLLQAELKLQGNNVAAFDAIALPAIRRLEADYCDGLLLEVKRDEALFKLREIVAEMGDARTLPSGVKATVLCVPASNLADEVTAEMLVEGLHVHGVRVECLSSRLTSGEMVAKAVELQPEIVCVSALCTASVTATAFICKHLRARLPQARVMVGLWQEEGEEYTKRTARLDSCGAQRVLPTFERMLTAVLEQIPPEQLKQEASDAIAPVPTQDATAAA